MRQVLLAAQAMTVAGLLVWVAAGSGCGAKSALRIDDEEEEIREPITPPPEECVEDADCDDGEFCNGPETCVDGFCEDPEPIACPEGDDCNMYYCDEERDQCVQIHIAADEDGDGFFARPCGADCNDSDPSVYPGAPEVCNCVDDDCDGAIDEDLTQDCDLGSGEIGHRQCIDCEWTECLMCTLCIPGAVRYCDTPTYCSWGEQLCNATGDSWGECYETSPPPSCTGFAYDQDCCMLSGSCCQDWIDSDHDGDWDDSVGACEDVLCPGTY